MEPEQIETSRLANELNKARNVELNMQVLVASLKQRSFIDARIALTETVRLVQLLNTLLDELDPPRHARMVEP